MLTKKSQLKKVKQSKKPSMKNKPKITEHEKQYLEWLQMQVHYRCFDCGEYWNDWHHVKFKSTDRKNHLRLIPLCKEHHTGNRLSPHGTPSKWRETYTIEEQNLEANKIYREFRNEKS